MMSSYVTVDLGATSGRVLVGRLEHDRLEIAEVHRFRNEPAGSGRDQHWNAEELFAQTVVGLQRAATQLDGAASSMGVTAWGVDVGLLDNHNKLVAPIQHYRAADPQDARRQEAALREAGVVVAPTNASAARLAAAAVA